MHKFAGELRLLRRSVPTGHANMGYCCYLRLSSVPDSLCAGRRCTRHIRCACSHSRRFSDSPLCGRNGSRNASWAYSARDRHVSSHGSRRLDWCLDRHLAKSKENAERGCRTTSTLFGARYAASSRVNWDVVTHRVRGGGRRMTKSPGKRNRGEGKKTRAKQPPAPVQEALQVTCGADDARLA